MARPRQGYYTQDGTPVPGVTTIIGILDKPALVGWAGKTCTDAAWEAGRQGEPKPNWRDVLYGRRDRAAEAGTMAHEYFEHFLRTGEDPELHERNEVERQAARAYRNARQWLRSSSLAVEPFEKPLVSEEFQYGGTPDAIARQDGKVYLADWKTGGLYRDHIIQMGAYAWLLWECRGMNVEGCWLVRFHREHGSSVQHYLDSEAIRDGWRTFRELRQAYEFLHKVDKYVS